MRLLSIFASLLAATALAAPGHHEQRSEHSVNVDHVNHVDFTNHQANFDGTIVTVEDLSRVPELAKSFEYASTAMGCKYLRCASLIIKAPCIIEKIKQGNISGVASCAAKKSVSSTMRLVDHYILKILIKI